MKKIVRRFYEKPTRVVEIMKVAYNVLLNAIHSKKNTLHTEKSYRCRMD